MLDFFFITIILNKKLLAMNDNNFCFRKRPSINHVIIFPDFSHAPLTRLVALRGSDQYSPPPLMTLWIFLGTSYKKLKIRKQKLYFQSLLPPDCIPLMSSCIRFNLPIGLLNSYKLVNKMTISLLAASVFHHTKNK